MQTDEARTRCDTFSAICEKSRVLIPLENYIESSHLTNAASVERGHYKDITQTIARCIVKARRYQLLGQTSCWLILGARGNKHDRGVWAWHLFGPEEEEEEEKEENKKKGKEDKKK